MMEKGNLKKRTIKQRVNWEERRRRVAWAEVQRQVQPV